MKKPKYQFLYHDMWIAFCGIVTVAERLNSLKTAGSLINFEAGPYWIGGVITIWFLFTRLVNKGDIKIPKKLKLSTNLGFGFVILLIAFFAGYDLISRPGDNELYAEEHLFSKNDKNFKLLIMPMHKECEYNGKKYDIGYVIAKRLESMAIKDSLHISMRCKMVTDKDSFFDRDSAYRLMKHFNADQILYGSYSLSECEGGTSDKVCFMYQVDSKNWDLPNEFTQHHEYKMMNFHGLDDIRYGAGQENIDYIIYWVAGISELRQKNYRRAIQLFQKIKDYQDKVAVLFQISNCYNHLGDYDNSHKSLEQVLKLNPHHEEANLHYCMRLLHEGKTEIARKKMEELNQQDPDNANVLSHLSYVYRKLGDSLNTQKYMDRFLALTPGTDKNYKDLGRYFEDMKYFARAKENYQRALRVCDKHADDWNDIGRTSILLGDSIHAKPFFVRALAIDGNSFGALYHLGMLYNREKNFTTAAEYLERAYPKDSANIKLLIELGKAYDGLKKTELALKKYEQALVRNRNHPIALIGASVIHMCRGEFEKANIYLDRMMKFFKYDFQLLDKTAYLCASRGNYRQAELYYKKMLKQMPGHGAVLYNLASMSISQQNRTAALNYLSRALTNMPKLKDLARRDKAFDAIRQEKKFISYIQ